MSAALTHLQPVQHRPNLTIRGGAEVREVISPAAVPSAYASTTER